MSGVRKRSKRNSSHGLQVRDNEAAASFRHRKDNNVQLHDEADLVNFRADNIRRFAQNQDLLQNVVSKLVHTSQIKPPRVFPEQADSYSQKSQEEVEQAVKDANASEVLVFSNIRLMRAKSKLLETEISAEQHAEPVLSEETEFQKETCDVLAQLQRDHRFDGDTEAMEKALAQALDECVHKHRKTPRASYVRYKKVAVSATDLDPNVKVEQAPAGYSVRRGGAEHKEAENVGKEMYDDLDEMMKPGEKSGREELNLGVNMNDLDQFLADSHPGASGMDEMDALMNFDQHMDDANADESFGVDFLNNMD